MTSTLRELRRAKGLSQTQLAAALRSSTSMVTSWEHGKTEPRATTVGKLAAALDVTEQAVIDAWKAAREERNAS